MRLSGIDSAYCFSRAEFAHILGAFPLVFPEDAQGRAKRAALLAVYDGMAVERD